jgi:hypothetical protein
MKRRKVGGTVRIRNTSDEWNWGKIRGGYKERVFYLPTLKFAKMQ